MLSGFLIVGILVDHRDAPNYFRVFFTRRALRILPPYVLLLMVFWLICAVVPENYYFGRRDSMVELSDIHSELVHYQTK